jgi:hypothetical protein
MNKKCSESSFFSVETKLIAKTALIYTIRSIIQETNRFRVTDKKMAYLENL